ncbi:toll-like receptor 4 [Mytilus californianus]|uniref:toll-like receptor 4 n=1 Tax=Mytilus californianus TaxID=6549 RepID=UPI0022454E8F|nr:toll-like receptor 4 [Mytilus californianus]
MHKMWNINHPYMLVTAFVFLSCCKHAILNETKEWTACLFAISCLCKDVPGSGNLIADCSDKDLLRIPRFPSNIQELYLRNNNISTIQDGIFEGNSLMTTLDLSFNNISQIRKNSFKGLTNLLSLNLSNNGLKYENISFEYSAFHFLENLKKLNLKRNVHTSFVPDLWKLRSLESLSIDYVEDKMAIFDEKFSYLKNLTILDLSGSTGNCKMTILTEKTFLFFTQISHLNLSKCMIQYLFKGTFKLLRNILELDVSLNTCLRFEALENITTDLQHSAIQILKFNYIHGFLEKTTVLKTSHIWNLRNTSIVRLEAAGNRIQTIESGAIKYLPETFKSVDIRKNMLSAGKYLLDLTNMSIASLEMSDNTSPLDIISSYVEKCPIKEETVTINSENNWLYTELPILELFKNRSGKFVFPMPRNLIKVSLRSSNVKFELPNLSFTANEIENVDFSDNVLHTWTGPITNVKKLTHLDLSANFCSNVSKTFFSPDFINLRCLLLQNNLLGLVIPTDVNGEIFQNLHNVVYINLSKNKITNIPNMLFQRQYNLESLDLSENMIEDINFKLSHMKKLTFLNLRNNRLSSLGNYVMNALNSIAKMKTNLTIDLCGNNLVCNCDSLSFLKWIIDTPTILHHREEYECKTSQNTISLLQNPREVYETIRKECMSYEGLIIGLTTGILMFIFILCGGIVYRYRWKLRYLYYMVKVKWNDPEPQSDNKDERLYMYDAFVSYANEDDKFVHHKLLNNLEKNCGIQLCLHRRNFLPGNDIATNITSAIHNSRKTIVIMSSNYLASYWCMFEYNMAKMESIYERNCENILFLVFYEQMSACNLPLRILELVHCQSYIEYPNDEYGDVVFWEQLQKAIKSY